LSVKNPSESKSPSTHAIGLTPEEPYSRRASATKTASPRVGLPLRSKSPTKSDSVQPGQRRGWGGDDGEADGGGDDDTDGGWNGKGDGGGDGDIVGEGWQVCEASHVDEDLQHDLPLPAVVAHG